MGLFEFFRSRKEAPPETRTQELEELPAQAPIRQGSVQTMFEPTSVPLTGPEFKGEAVPYYPNRGRGVPSVPPALLLKSQEKLIREIRQASSLAYEDFDSYILPVIRNYAEFVHLLPASECHHHADLGGLFRHGLEVALIACRRSESYEFGLNEDSSVRKFQIFRWRACALLGGMMHDLGKPIIDVGAVDASGKLIWNPHVYSIWEWIKANDLKYYYINWNNQRIHQEHDAISATVIARLMPHETMKWMGEFRGRVPYDAMLMALAHSQSRTNPLIEIIKQSDSDSVNRDQKESNVRMAAVGEGGRRGLGARFIRVIRDNIANSKWQINKLGGMVFHTTAGLYGLTPAVPNKIMEDMRSRNEEGVPDDATTVNIILEEHGYIHRAITAKGNTHNIFQLVVYFVENGVEKPIELDVIKFVDEAAIPDYFQLPQPLKAHLVGEDPSKASAPQQDAPAAPQPAPSPTEPGSEERKGQAAAPTDSTPAPAQAPASASQVDFEPMTYSSDDDDDPTAEVGITPGPAPAPSGAVATTGQGAPPQAEPSQQQDLRDRLSEKDHRDVVIDEGVADARKPFPPTNVEDAQAWIDAPDRPNNYLKYVIYKVANGELVWGRDLIIEDERLYIRYPEIFNGSGAQLPAHGMQTLFEANWIERDPGESKIHCKRLNADKAMMNCLRFTRDHTSALMLLLPKPQKVDPPKRRGPYIDEELSAKLNPVGGASAPIASESHLYRLAFFQFMRDEQAENWSGEWHAQPSTNYRQYVSKFCSDHNLPKKFLTRHLTDSLSAVPQWNIFSLGSKAELEPNAVYDPQKDLEAHEGSQQ